jgi:hypothetical protein
MRPVLNDPVKLAVMHGLVCSLLPLFSLGACLGMLRGETARLRIWPVIGILLVPLPGQLFIVTEVNPTIQLAWVLFVFIWRGCPVRWSPVAAIAMLAMATLHPAAVPLFFFAAIMAVVFAMSKDALFRRQTIVWGMIFAAASLGKLAECMILATPYERASMSLAVWITELKTGLRFSLFPALVPVLIDVGLYAWSFFSKQTQLRPPWLSKTLWIAAFVLGTIYVSDTGGWAAAINYRKFVVVVSAPMALLASIDAWRLRRIANGSPAIFPEPRIALIYPAVLFASMLCGMALSWKSLCASLMTQLAVHAGPVMVYGELPKPWSDSALNHWSTTSLSLVLQGWEPKKIFIWDGSLQLSGNRFCVCPGEEFGCEDRSFKLGWVAGICPAGTGR